MVEGASSGISTQVDSSVDDRGDDAAHDGPRLAGALGRFAILERLGSGGMGQVFAAYDEQLDRKVALKVLHDSRRLTTASQTRLLREAQALARLSHPNVVTVYEAGVHEGRVFIAMEFVRGRTLRAWLREKGRTWGEILQVFVAAAEGLAAMHEHGLVHRDFKPDNVLIDVTGRPRLIDFGLVRPLMDESDAPTRDEPSAPARAEDAAPGEGEGKGTRADGDASPPSSSPMVGSLTRTGALVGTPLYMSPEQFQRQPVTPASDQFSLCVALFEALYGISPFPGDTPSARAVGVIAGRIVEPPAVDVPSELLAVLTRGLRVEPEARWPDMPALLSALRALLASYDPEIEDATAMRSRRRLLVILLSAVVIVLASFGVLGSMGSEGITAERVVIMDVVMLLVVGGAALGLRRTWAVTRHGRRILGVLLVLLVTFFLQDLTGLLSGRSLYHSILANGVCVTTICFFAAPFTAQVLRWAALWCGLCTAAMVLDPSRFFLYFNVGNLGASAAVVLVFPRRTVDRWIRTAASEGSTASTASRSRSQSPSRSRG